MASTLLTPHLLQATRSLDTLTWQTVVNLLGSRCRAIATAFAVQSMSMDQDGRIAFAAVAKFEVTSANILLGLGTCLHPTGIHPPAALKILSKIMLYEELEDFKALQLLLEDARDPDDALLYRYEGNWWSPFDHRLTLEDRNLRPEDLLVYWELQKKTLPRARQPLHPTIILNTGLMADEELKVAWNVSKDALEMLDEEIADSLVHIGDITMDITRQQELLADMEALLENQLEEESSKDIMQVIWAAKGTVDSDA